MPFPGHTQHAHMVLQTQYINNLKVHFSSFVFYSKGGLGTSGLGVLCDTRGRKKSPLSGINMQPSDYNLPYYTVCLQEEKNKLQFQLKNVTSVYEVW